MISLPTIDLLAVARTIKEPWVPLVVGTLNGQHLKLARFEGEFMWHDHADQDECFIVLEGHMTMHLTSGDVHLGQWQSITIPRGVQHCPAGSPMALVLLFEPTSTQNTGNVASDLTIKPEDLEHYSDQ